MKDSPADGAAGGVTAALHHARKSRLINVVPAERPALHLETLYAIVGDAEDVSLLRDVCVESPGSEFAEAHGILGDVLRPDLVVREIGRSKPTVRLRVVDHVGTLDRRIVLQVDASQ